jgi:hypothetical protein
MKELQEKELKRLITFLDAINCQYKIITNDGQTFMRGNVVPAPPKPERKKRNLTMPYGTIAAHYRPFIDMKAKVGDVMEIPLAHFDPVTLRGAISSYLTKGWGKKTYTSMIAKDSIQIMKTQETE